MKLVIPRRTKSDVGIRFPLNPKDNSHCTGERIATASLRTGFAMTWIN